MKATDQELVETNNLNTFPLVMMNRFLGPEMLARGKHRSGIINMTSYYVDNPVYTLPMLSAGKAL